MAAMRVLAELLQPVESETPFGGRAVSYEPLGRAWLACGPRRRRERREGDAPGRAVEAMTAETRPDGRLGEGRVLRFGGGDWAIVAVEADGGQARLSLERGR
jgi:hypothetical protein